MINDLIKGFKQEMEKIAKSPSEKNFWQKHKQNLIIAANLAGVAIPSYMIYRLVHDFKTGKLGKDATVSLNKLMNKELKKHIKNEGHVFSKELHDRLVRGNN